MLKPNDYTYERFSKHCAILVLDFDPQRSTIAQYLLAINFIVMTVFL